MAMLMIAPARRSTPTAALNIIYDLPPLHLVLKETAIMTAARIRPILGAQCQWIAELESRTGHFTLLERNLPAIANDLDTIPKRKVWEKPYLIQITGGTPDAHKGVTVYTDGSLINGQSGCGGVIYEGDTQVATFSERLNDCTVYQAELRAIQAATELLTGSLNESITVYVDNQASLMALQAVDFNQRTTLDTHRCLEKLAETNTIQLKWCKAHVGHEGNEAADTAAKNGAASERWGPHIPTAKATLKSHIRELTINKWEGEWRIEDRFRQSKIFLTPTRRYWNKLQRSKKAELRKIIAALTGHGYLKRHQFIVEKGQKPDEDDDVKCRLCLEEEETHEHIIRECPALSQQRSQIFGVYHIPDVMHVWHPSQIKQMLSIAAVDKLSDENAELTFSLTTPI